MMLLHRGKGVVVVGCWRMVWRGKGRMWMVRIRMMVRRGRKVVVRGEVIPKQGRMVKMEVLERMPRGLIPRKGILPSTTPAAPRTMRRKAPNNGKLADVFVRGDRGKAIAKRATTTTTTTATSTTTVLILAMEMATRHSTTTTTTMLGIPTVTKWIPRNNTTIIWAVWAILDTTEDEYQPTTTTTIICTTTILNHHNRRVVVMVLVMEE